MSKGENRGKGKGKGNGVEDDKGRSVYVVSVNTSDQTATVVRTPVGEEGSDGEVMLLVPNHIVELLTDAAYDGNSKLIRKLVAQNIRAKLKDVSEFPEFEAKVLDINLDNMDEKEPKKGKPVDDVEPVGEIDPPVTEPVTQPWQS